MPLYYVRHVQKKKTFAKGRDWMTTTNLIWCTNFYSTQDNICMRPWDSRHLATSRWWDRSLPTHLYLPVTTSLGSQKYFLSTKHNRKFSRFIYSSFSSLVYSFSLWPKFSCFVYNKAFCLELFALAKNHNYKLYSVVGLLQLISMSRFIWNFCAFSKCYTMLICLLFVYKCYS